MKFFACILAVFGLMSTLSCEDPNKDLLIPEPVRVPYASDSIHLTDEERYEKVLGALVGSAIGDAMGASTEMWHRSEIRQRFGYITGLTSAVRSQSPEGTWDHNLNAGATTDDTRWKFLMVRYFLRHPNNSRPEHFAKFITDYYQSAAAKLADKEILTKPDALSGRIEKVDWILEWARVAMAYQEGPKDYGRAQHRFYGGETSCAGMLYTPMFGLKAINPEEAYMTAYDHSIFDLGYGKDISALVAAMTHMAMRTQSVDSIIDTAVFVDPFRYQDSRLVGRISLDVAERARRVVRQAVQSPPPDSLALDSLSPAVPKGFPGGKADWHRLEIIYSALEEHEQATAFHAGEIWEILIAALEYGQGDFEKTMAFIVNYGRDNDTVAAVAGMILGARAGYTGLPRELRTEVIRVNRQQIGIDLEKLAREFVSGRAEIPEAK